VKEDAAPADLAPEPPRPPTLLLVDDRPDNLFVLNQLIAEHLPDCVTVAAHNARDAIALAADREFDGILADVQMPAIDGIELCRRLKAAPDTARVPVLLITAQSASPRLRVQGLEAGADDFLTKPLAPAELIARIKVMLRIKRAEDELRAINRDLEARVVRRAREVHESEARYRALVDSASEHIFTLDRNGIFLFSNNRLDCVHPSATLVGRNVAEVHTPEVAALYLRQIERVFTTERPVTFEHAASAHDGPRHHLDTLYPIRRGLHIRAAGGICRDVTERKRAEEALRNSEARFRTLFEESPVGIWEEDFSAVHARFRQWRDQGVTDLRAHLEANPAEVAACAALVKILDVNLTSAFMFGAAGKRDLALNLPDYFTEDSLKVFREELIALDSGATRFESEIVIRAPAGDLRTLYLRLAVLPEHAANLSRILVTFVDITDLRRAAEERQRLQARLIQAQRLESLGVLSSGVAHEINNPLHAVLNYSELILDGLPEGDPNRPYAAEIIKETERIAAIVRNLLAFARPQKQGHTPERIRDVLDNTLSLIRTIVRHDNILLHIEVPEALPKVRCRSQQIAQVIMNLVTNARDALNERYPAPHDDKQLLISARALARDGFPWIRLTFEDRGPGIKPDVLPRIFDPFFTTKPRAVGTGLGLAICHGIVREHGGELRVESEYGKYTRFHLDLRAETP
jgi:PAS domain S-box-containing protein